jgi:cobalamin biosynthesis protein CobT
VADDAVLTQAFLDRYVGFVIHELCHVKYTDFSVKATTQYMRQLHNAVEDVWIERRAIADGMTGNIAGVFSKLINQMIAEAGTEGMDDPRNYPWLFACHGRRYAKRIALPQGLAPIFDEASARIDSAKSSYDTLKIAEWIMSQLQQLPEQSPEQGQDKSEGEGQEGEGQEGTQEATGDAPSDQSGSGEGEGAGEGDNGVATAPVDDQDARETEPNCEVPESQAGIGSYDKSAGLGDSEDHTFPQVNIDTTVAVPSKLRHEVRQLFEKSGLDEFQLNRKAGQINSSVLASIATGNVRVFKRHHEEGGIDSAVVIVLDASGSMSGSRAVNAVKTCVALYETLTQSGVAVQILAFNFRTSVLVPFNTPVAKAKQTLSHFITNYSTNDYFAIRYAHEILNARPETRKIAFVLTDGNGWKDEVRSQIKQGNNLGITTVGVGIELDVSSVYENNVCIRDIKDLANASFKQIKLVA